MQELHNSFKFFRLFNLFLKHKQQMKIRSTYFMLVYTGKREKKVEASNKIMQKNNIK